MRQIAVLNMERKLSSLPSVRVNQILTIIAYHLHCPYNNKKLEMAHYTSIQAASVKQTVPCTAKNSDLDKPNTELFYHSVPAILDLNSSQIVMLFTSISRTFTLTFKKIFSSPTTKEKTRPRNHVDSQAVTIIHKLCKHIK
jgi:hypothetical protein